MYNQINSGVQYKYKLYMYLECIQYKQIILQCARNKYK